MSRVMETFGVMIYGRMEYAENSAVQGDAALIVAGT